MKTTTAEETYTNLIEFDFMRQTEGVPGWSSEMTFFIPLKGTAELLVKNEIITLTERDIFYVPPFQYFCVTGIEGICLQYGIHADEVKDVSLTRQVNRFYVNSSAELDKRRFFPLLKLIGESVLLLQDGRSELLEKKYIYSLAEELIRNHCVWREDQKNAQGNDILSQLPSYLEENYREQLTLEDVAAHFYVSSSNLSRLMKNEWGVSFAKYVKDVRLMHAAGELLLPNRSIEQIALENGYSTPRTFSKNFREYYGVLPSKYRSTNKSRSDLEQRKIDVSDVRECLIKLLESLPGGGGSDTNRPLKKHMLPEVKPDHSTQCDAGFTHSILTIRRASHLLIPHSRKYIVKMIEELGFSQIYLHEFFHDEMEVYLLDRNKVPYYHFYRVDQILDFVETYHLTPYIELAFVPYAMAKNADQRKNNSVSSMPNDMEEWKKLIQNLLRHLIERYGSDTVAGWKFCVWNSPDNVMINCAAEQYIEFFRLYKETYAAIKEIDARIPVGPAPLMNVSVQQPDWMNQFADFYKRQNCVPDFLMVNMYMLETNLEQIKMLKPLKRSTNADALAEGLQEIRLKGEQYHWGITDYIVPEWSFDLCSRDPYMEDDIFKAVYIVKNMADCFDAGIRFGVADPIDRYPDNSADNRSFRGSFGLVTYDGILKASYFAYRILNQLGDRLVFKSEGCLITRSDRQIQILLYNYQHYSEEYAQRICPSNQGNAAFKNMHDLEFQIPLSGLKHRYYEQVTLILNEDFGNAFGFCQKYWEPKTSDPQSVTYLNQVCQPLLKKQYIEPDREGRYVITESLKPLEVRLLLLTYL